MVHTTRRKIGLGILVALSALAFVAPFLFKQSSHAVGPGGGNGGGPSTGGTETPASTPHNAPPTSPPSSTTPPGPPPGWQGYHGFCHGEGHHYGIEKKADKLGVTLPTCD